jgi:adenylate cyclase class IV
VARNVEIKARIASVEALLPLALACADGPPELIAQDDTFFACTTGRLKLRAFADGRGELIAYQRPDTDGPKTSDYTIAPVADPDALRAALARALGLVGRVVKRRTLLMAGRSRLHLDRVDGLGDFLEIEVVLRDGECAGDGVAIAHALMRRLQIDADALESGAYVDLLMAGSTSAAATATAPR